MIAAKSAVKAPLSGVLAIETALSINRGHGRVLRKMPVQHAK
jgi:hypothetical protein